MSLLARTTVSKLGKEHISAKPVYQYNIMGNFLKKWDCIVDAGRFYAPKSINPGCGITMACKGNVDVIYGYRWSYDFFDNLGNPSDRVSSLYIKNNTIVYQYNMAGEFVRSFESCYSAAKLMRPNGDLTTTRTNIFDSAIGKKISMYGFLWSFKKKERLNSYESILLNNKKNRSSKISKPVLATDLKKNETLFFTSIKDCAIHFNIIEQTISRILKSNKVYKNQFKFNYK